MRGKGTEKEEAKRNGRGRQRQGRQQERELMSTQKKNKTVTFFWKDLNKLMLSTGGTTGVRRRHTGGSVFGVGMKN